jgi:hypothetical protein
MTIQSSLGNLNNEIIVAFYIYSAKNAISSIIKTAVRFLI